MLHTKTVKPAKRNVNRLRVASASTARANTSLHEAVVQASFFKLTPRMIFGVLVMMVLVTLYLSTQILPSEPAKQYIQNNPHNADVANNGNPPLTDPGASQLDKSSLSFDLHTAVQKSLNSYILRPGHNDRVEYMIGFRGERITDAEHYQSLQTRNTQHYDRDYRKSPIKIRQWLQQPASETVCDALCEQCQSRGDCDVNGVKFSMENVQVHERENIITGSTKLDSLVPVPYFSWHDFEFLLPMQLKTADALAAAFISNCGFPKRNKIVRNLQTYGVKVHSFGRCEHNKDEQGSKHGKGRSKIDILQTYKFSLAFENSETDDYITEKFFGTLQSGSVPVYIGAHNVKFFAPDVGDSYRDVGKPWKSKAVIYAGDFDFDAKRLAEYLLYLDSNDTAYNEYLQWKVDGYSGDFKAMVDLTAKTHTNCRQCILATDWSRYANGVGAYDMELNGVFKPGSDGGEGKWVYVRERGMYRFAKIKLEFNTLESLVRSILIAIKPKPTNFWKNNDHPDYSRIGPAVYAIYHMPSKHVIHSDAAIANLPEGAELEVILL